MKRDATKGGRKWKFCCCPSAEASAWRFTVNVKRGHSRSLRRLPHLQHHASRKSPAANSFAASELNNFDCSDSRQVVGSIYSNSRRIFKSRSIDTHFNIHIYWSIIGYLNVYTLTFQCFRRCVALAKLPLSHQKLALPFCSYAHKELSFEFKTFRNVRKNCFLSNAT